jgi:hypothetical protein
LFEIHREFFKVIGSFFAQQAAKISESFLTQILDNDVEINTEVDWLTG